MNKKLLVCVALAALFAAGPALPQMAASGASNDPAAGIVAVSPADQEMAIALELFAAHKNDEAIQHLIAAADGGNVSAQVMLGMMYLHGPVMYNLDIDQDLGAALTLLNRAALAGSAVAKYTLANIELFGMPRTLENVLPRDKPRPATPGSLTKLF